MDSRTGNLSSDGKNCISSLLDRKRCDLSEEHFMEVNKLSECNVSLTGSIYSFSVRVRTPELRWIFASGYEH